MKLRLAPRALSEAKRKKTWWLKNRPAAPDLFEEEFKLHIFGTEYGFPMPDAVAYLVATAELALPVLLILGLATRFAALAMLVMTGIIQLVVPDGWANFHLPWAALAISIIALGAGPLSVDRLISRQFAAEAYRQ